MPEARTGKTRLARLERERKAHQLRLAGLTYSQIGEELGLSESGAFKSVMRFIDNAKAIDQEDAERHRSLELDRLDKAQAAVWNRVLGGDLKAVGAFLKISGHRSSLLGLNAPTRIAGPDGGPLELDVRATLESRLARLASLGGAGPDTLKSD